MPRKLPDVFIIDDGMKSVFIDLVDNVIKFNRRVFEVNYECFERSVFIVELKSMYRSKIFIEHDAKSFPDVVSITVSAFDANSRHDENVFVGYRINSL